MCGSWSRVVWSFAWHQRVVYSFPLTKCRLAPSEVWMCNISRKWSQGSDVDFRVPDTIGVASFRWMPTLSVWQLPLQTGIQQRRNYTIDCATVLSVVAIAPQQVPASFRIRLFLVFIFWLVFSRCFLFVRVLSRVKPRYFEFFPAIANVWFGIREAVI